MAIQFPANPTVGDSFNSEGVTYVWDGTVWAASGSAAFLTKDLLNAQLVGTDASGDLVENDAPVDGSKYTRQNGGWSEITETGGDFITVDYNGASAWGTVHGDGTALSGLNFTATKTGTGEYTVTFTNPMPSGEYSAQVTCLGGSSTTIRNAVVKGRSATDFDVSIKNESNDPTDASFSFAVHALNALPPSKGTGADAWAYMEFNGNVQASFNMTGQQASAGTYAYTFNTPMPNDKYAVIAQVQSSTDQDLFLTVKDQTQNGFTVTAIQASDLSLKVARHSVVVHATTAALPNTLLKEDLLYSDGRQDSTSVQVFGAGIRLGSDVNTLSDYEEGTWIPEYAASTTNPTCTYDIQNGRYVRIGNVVHCEGRLRTETVSGGSGDLRIDGLPFLSAAESTVRAGIDIGVGAAWGVNRPTEGLVLHNTTQLNLFYSTTNNYAVLTVSDLNTGSKKNSLQFSVTYITSG